MVGRGRETADGRLVGAGCMGSGVVGTRCAVYAVVRL
jgi:hypothetical protein